MKYAWKQVSTITTSQRHLGSHRTEPIVGVVPGDVYQNKVTGYTYELVLVDDDADNSDWHSRGELPPVGVECEYFWCSRPEEWRKVKITDNGFDEGIPCVSLRQENELRINSDPANFRPLKTERDRAIEEMHNIANNDQSCASIGAIEKLYDAGYRKDGK